MLRRLALLALPSLLLTFAGCTASDPQLAQQGDTCDEDLQCVQPLVCACVQTRGTGDDGNDEIVRHGTCQRPGFQCVKDDAGGETPTFDTAPLDGNKSDSGADGAPSESGTDATDATDGGGSDAISSDVDETGG